MSKLFLVPLAFAVSFPLIFLITYGVAVGNGHVPPIFTYISDTGTIPPEMCVFGQLLNLSCILLFCVIYVRYRQVAEYYRQRYKQKCKPNTVAYAIGILSVLGSSMVANFQLTNQFIPHSIGAIFALLFAGIWCCINGYLSLKLLPDFSSKRVAYVRIFLGALGVIIFIIFQATGIESISQFKGEVKDFTVEKTLNWKSTQAGWELRGVSVVFEWMLITLFVIYMLTLVSEFQKLDYRAPQIIINVDDGSADQNEEHQDTNSTVDPSSAASEAV